MPDDIRAKGALFANDRKEKPNQPDMTGPCDMGDRKLRIAAWWHGDGDKRYLSFEVTTPRERLDEGEQRQSTEHKPLENEDIPF